MASRKKHPAPDGLTDIVSEDGARATVMRIANFLDWMAADYARNGPGGASPKLAKCYRADAAVLKAAAKRLSD